MRANPGCVGDPSTTQKPTSGAKLAPQSKSKSAPHTGLSRDIAPSPSNSTEALLCSPHIQGTRCHPLPHQHWLGCPASSLWLPATLSSGVWERLCSGTSQAPFSCTWDNPLHSTFTQGLWGNLLKNNLCLANQPPTTNCKTAWCNWLPLGFLSLKPPVILACCH